MGINYGPDSSTAYQEDGALGSLLNTAHIPRDDYTPRYSDGRPMFTDPDGKPLTALQADKLLGDRRRRHLARTWLKYGRERVVVSTIFLPLDTGFMGVSEKWETMVFGGPLDQWQDRYACRTTAKLGHKITVFATRLEIARLKRIRDRQRRMHAAYRARRA